MTATSWSSRARYRSRFAPSSRPGTRAGISASTTSAPARSFAATWCRRCRRSSSIPRRGNFGQYLRSLERLKQLRPRTLYPAHGLPTQHADEKLAEYLAHRRARAEALAAALARGPRDLTDLVAEVYADVPPIVHVLAARSALASLEWLASSGRARPAGPPSDPSSRWELAKTQPGRRHGGGGALFRDGRTVTEWTESRNWTESTETYEAKRSASRNWTESMEAHEAKRSALGGAGRLPRRDSGSDDGVAVGTIASERPRCRRSRRRGRCR